jgi:hypothetical protein
VSLVHQTLFAGPATVRAVERARALVLLIGGYDGSGNYGDIALLDAALAAVGRLGDGVLALPVLERQLLDSHRQLLPAFAGDNPHALFFDPGEGIEDELIAVAAPAALNFGACYLYGGGYCNRRWGARKLAMLESAETLLAEGGAGRICRLASGLQVEAEWVAELDDRERAALGDFDLLGVRDRASGEALEALAGRGPVIETGDDAIGVLGRLPGAGEPAADADRRLLVNLHFAEHAWVSERPAAMLDFYTGFVAELGRLARRPVVAQPLIAYLDGRIDERGGVERLTAALGSRGVEVAEPLRLQPADLDATAPGLRGAELTLSCSYHVALTSLMLGVPALLIGDNDYYEQKAAGLREDFGLPASFATTTSAEPDAVAGALAPLLFDPDGAGELRRLLDDGAEALRRRRAEAEAELVGRLGGGGVRALSDHATAQAEQLRQRSAEPAELHAQLGALRSEREELRRRAGESPLEAEIRAHEAEFRAHEAEAHAHEAEFRAREAEASTVEAHRTLAAVLETRSWRMLAPLHRLRARLRRG